MSKENKEYGPIDHSKDSLGEATGVGREIGIDMSELETEILFSDKAFSEIMEENEGKFQSRELAVMITVAVMGR